MKSNRFKKKKEAIYISKFMEKKCVGGETYEIAEGGPVYPRTNSLDVSRLSMSWI